MSFAISAALFLVLMAGNALVGVDAVRLVGGNLLGKVMWINLSLALFNLLPAFPMDGGRVLRALLAQRMEYGQATRTAAGSGQTMAFFFGFLGLLFNPFLLFIALFVYLGATQEAAVVQAELAFRGVPVREAMMTQFGTLFPTDRISRATELLLAGAQHDFPVVEDGRLVGLLTWEALIQALGERGPASAVSDAMRPPPPTAAPDDSLETTFQQMTQADARTVPVVRDGHVVGLITLENIGEFLMIRSAVEAQHARAGAGSAPVTAEGFEAAWLGPGRTPRGQRAGS